MAGTNQVKLDLHGSIQQQGFTSLKHDYAVRHVLVRGLANTNLDLGTAIRLAFNDPGVGLFHQSLYLLPLTKIRAVKWGKNKAKLQLIYQRSRFSVPPINALDTASTSKAYEFVPVYKMPFVSATEPANDYTNGLPTGEWHNLADPLDKSKPPISYRHRVAVVRIVYNTVLSFNPFAQTEQHLNKVNKTGIKMGGIVFPPGTLRFDGVDAEASQVFKGSGLGGLPNASKTFAVQYQFTANPNGHYRQYSYWDDTTWATVNKIGYEESTFKPKDFPAHG